MNRLPFEALIDSHRYPIAEETHPRREAAIRQARRCLEADGCAVLDGFLSDKGLNVILGEALARRDRAYFSDRQETNIYFSRPDASLPPDHPVNIMMPRTNGFITADTFGPESLAFGLYHWPPLGRFLADCLGKDELHIYADPVSNMIVNVATPGTTFPWHFDTNEFTITMLLRAAESGGRFEYAPGIRTPENENETEVAALLAGDRHRVRQLDLRPGDLQLFLGRYSLHRVTENTGDSDRLLIIMSFAEQPDMIGNAERVRQLYGKVTDAHERQQSRHDNLMD